LFNGCSVTSAHPSALNATTTRIPSKRKTTLPPTYETRSVRFKESSSAQSQSKDEDDPVALVTKLKSLSVYEPSYLVLYSQWRRTS